jgi:hypothetical protein
MGVLATTTTSKVSDTTFNLQALETAVDFIGRRDLIDKDVSARKLFLHQVLQHFLQ